MSKYILHAIIFFVGIIIGYTIIVFNLLDPDKSINDSFEKKTNNSLVEGINFRGIVKSRDAQKITIVNSQDELDIQIANGTTILNTASSDKGINLYADNYKDIVIGSAVSGVAILKKDQVQNKYILIANTIIK